MVGAFPDGCRFHPRCTFAVDACRAGPSGDIALEPVTPTQISRCIRVGEIELGVQIVSEEAQP
jgi:ABC-type dipeptide/oligopeptide/nickel transport system ATPase component